MNRMSGIVKSRAAPGRRLPACQRAPTRACTPPTGCSRQLNQQCQAISARPQHDGPGTGGATAWRLPTMPVLCSNGSRILRTCNRRVPRAGMGGQVLDARQRISANSSIPLEKRSRLGKNGSPRLAAAAGPRNGSCMLKSYFQRLFADPNGTAALVRRLLMEQAAGQWRRYALAFSLMGIAAASTALGAYLVGDVINQAYVHKNLPGIVILALVTAVIFMIKGMATYGQAVMLARIGNRIIADNQQRMFARLLQHNVSFFADRHSSEFMARLTTGAAAASNVLNLLITSLGRDLLSLIGLAAVMAVQDPRS